MGCTVTGGDERASWKALGMIRAPDQPSPGPRLMAAGHLDFAWRMPNLPPPLKLQVPEQRAASCQELGSQALTSSGRSNGSSLGGERRRLCSAPHGAPDQARTPEVLPTLQCPLSEFSVLTIALVHSLLVAWFQLWKWPPAGNRKEGQNILSGSQAIVVSGRNDQARTVFLFCFSYFFFLSKPLILPLSPPSYLVAEKTLDGRRRQSQENYGDRGHREETAPGDHLEKGTTVIFRQNQ